MKLLIHICCAPCSISCIEALRAEGLAPEDFLSYYKQQYRWARGALDLLFREGILFTPGFTIAQRIGIGRNGGGQRRRRVCARNVDLNGPGKLVKSRIGACRRASGGFGSPYPRLLGLHIREYLFSVFIADLSMHAARVVAAKRGPNRIDPAVTLFNCLAVIFKKDGLSHP